MIVAPLFTHGLKDSRGLKGGLMIIGHSNIILLQYYNTNSNIILLQYYNITMYYIVTILQYYNVYYNVYNITMYSNTPCTLASKGRRITTLTPLFTHGLKDSRGLKGGILPWVKKEG